MENDKDVYELTFRMELVEKEVEELKDVVRQQLQSDAEFRRTLEKAMFDLMSKLGKTNDSLEQVVGQIKPLIEDYRERTYGKSYLRTFFKDARITGVLLIGAALLLVVEYLPKVVALLMAVPK